jgi:hypothetical protein
MSPMPLEGTVRIEQRGCLHRVHSSFYVVDHVNLTGLKFECKIVATIPCKSLRVM